MNRYLKQFIEKYELRGAWDTRATNVEKAMKVPEDIWCDIIVNPKQNGCYAGYRFYGDHKVQGVITPDRKYFIYECSPRYILGDNPSCTFIAISTLNTAIDNLGYSDEYLYIRDIVQESNKNNFSDNHTYIAYSILKEHENFKDITTYREFLTRYVGENGAPLCTRKHVIKVIADSLGGRLKSNYDFTHLDWDVYEEVVKDVIKPYFYHQYKSTDNDIVWLNCGLYETKTRRVVV